MRVLVYGLGKTGTTAVVHAIAAALPGHPMLLEPHSLAAVDADAPDLLVKSVRANAWRDERARFASFDRRILIVRHPLDRLLSHVLYAPYNGHGFSEDAQAERFVALVRAKVERPDEVPMRSLVELLDAITGSNLAATTRQHAERIVALDRRLGDRFHRLRYEDFVDGRTEALSDYLGVRVAHEVEVRDELRRVARTRRHGDFHRWFLPEDVDWLREALAPFAEHFGYSLELDPAVSRTIDPAGAHLYVGRVIDAYRDRYRLPRFVPGERRLGPEGACFDRAVEALRVGDLDAAETSLVEGLERVPESAPFWLRLAIVLSQRNRTTEALFAASRARALAPDSVEAAQLARRLRELLAREGKTEPG